MLLLGIPFLIQTNIHTHVHTHTNITDKPFKIKKIKKNTALVYTRTSPDISLHPRTLLSHCVTKGTRRERDQYLAGVWRGGVTRRWRHWRRWARAPLNANYARRVFRLTARPPSRYCWPPAVLSRAHDASNLLERTRFVRLLTSATRFPLQKHKK